MPFVEALLVVLPAEVDGHDVRAEPDAFAASASDADLVRDAAAGVVGSALDPTGADYAIGFVYRLREGVFDETWFRDWRDSFDAGVCAQAGGVAGNASADIGGHPTFIGSCAGGVLTYQLHLVEPTTGADLIVAIQALGAKRYGELMVEGLRI